ncbi:hypothetical protein [Pseudomonas sp. UFMG81]|uniref:hypothetical protein n=1 Tax=Pseudomonas sp. UFMG81 TaxID=2745936 RepID=UPI002B26915D|nr:hypothetical protein [Pseudomonas sp. UFMG81]
MKRVARWLTLSGLGLLFGCTPGQTLNFDVQYGYYHNFLREYVGDRGQLTCQVVIHENHTGEKWVPSVILAAAQDENEDYTLFLSSSPLPHGSSMRTFNLRTFVDAKPVIDEHFLNRPNNHDRYGLRLAWHADGSISYQVDNGDGWTPKATVQAPGFKVRHVSAHASGVKGVAHCELSDSDA